MKTYTLRNGDKVVVPEIEIGPDNAYGLLIVSRRKLYELLGTKESKRSEMHALSIEFVNSIIFRCMVVLDIGIGQARRHAPGRPADKKLAPSEFHRKSRELAGIN